MHYNCYTVCGRAPNVSLLTGHIFSPYADLRPLKINFCQIFSNFFFFQALTLINPIHILTFLSFVTVNFFVKKFLFFVCV